jgi:V8-like Glu-specific endopeptidase
MANAAEKKAIGSACRGCRNQTLAEDYWTEERRAQAEHRARAKLFSMPKAGGGERPATTDAALPKGPPGSTPGHNPDSHGDEKSSAPELELHGAGTEVEVSDPLTYPWRTVGKLLYTQNGQPDAGSGALISPNILLTAGHCLYDKKNGGYSIGVDFFPSWGVGAKGRDQKDPFYKFNCSFLAWWLAWEKDRNYAYDYGLAWIDKAPGNHLGWLGYAWNQTTQGRRWTAYGYPPADPKAPTAGNTMKAVVGHNAESPMKGMIAMTNNLMGHGASGGPWVTTDPVETDPNDHWPYHVNGVHSIVYAPPLIACSPYLTHELGELMEWISNPANRK